MNWLTEARRSCALLLALLCAATGWAAEKPHIVYILADDLGWKDVGFHGGKIQTPNLDKLAAGGAVLNALYAQPFSSQTRAALLTGRYPMRYGLQTMSILPSSQFGLPSEERTLAQGLKDAGYKTALIGKWQLGHAKPEFWPTKRGFDYFYGTLSGNVEAELKKTGKSDWRRNEQPLKEDGFVTALLAKDAARYIEQHDSATPLFLLLSFTAPAAPFAAPKEFLDKYRDIADETLRSYAASVTALDDAVGQVVGALEKKKMRDQTLLVFHSDNGGALPMKFPTGDGDVKKAAADNDIYREGKGSLYEGGVRVAALVHWPGKLKEKTVVTRMLHVTDMYTTLLTLAGAKLEQAKKPDGLDVWGTLAQAQASPRSEILLNVEDFSGAIRVGEWKLIVRAALPSKYELFDIANDPEEATNQAETYPDRVKEMLTKLNAYAYDMAPAKYLEQLAKTKSGETPIYWGHNSPRR
jgi:arylsulfatase A-like enzyme